ncbi:MAG: type II secretion system F family protein [Candidatus Solibacter usitatus]|nr:type II secretion system F family protein [Candidatus Solibacter usitatus]
MVLAFIVFVIVMGLTLLLFTKFGGASAKADMEKIRARLLGKTKVKAKKKGEGADAPSLIKSDEPQGAFVVGLLKKLELAERVQGLIERSGVRWTAQGLLQTSLGLALVAFNVVWYLASPPLDRFAWLAAALAFCMPFTYLRRLGTKRMRRFEEQFPDSLEFVARSMRAGHAFSVSLEMIHREFAEPLSGEFRRTFDEQNLGLPLDIALQNFAKRVPLLEVHFFVSAVLLQKRTGGNLAELLDKLAYVIRERFKLRGRIRAVSAHGRMTASALSIIPLVVAAMMFYVNPDYISFFVKDETGHVMAGVAIGFQVVGYLVMKHIVNIEV